MQEKSINDQELNNVVALPKERRYKYFVNNVADWEFIWGLKCDSGWVLAGDDLGNEYFPVWPHGRFALLCAIGDWDGCVPTPIALDDWLNRWTPGMIKDGQSVAVFPIPNFKGIGVKPNELEADIREALSDVE